MTSHDPILIVLPGFAPSELFAIGLKHDDVHIVHNTGSLTYHFNASNVNHHPDPRNHMFQQNNFSLRGFTAASKWMDEYQPKVNFFIPQHYVHLLRNLDPPACEVETLHLRQSSTINSADLKSVHSGRTIKELIFVTHIMWNIFNATCESPFLEANVYPDVELPPLRNRRHIIFWSEMFHNSILFTPRDRFVSNPLPQWTGTSLYDTSNPDHG